MIVLDSRAVLAYLRNDPGGKAVSVALERGAVISHVTLLEVSKALPQVPVHTLLAVFERTGIAVRFAEVRHLGTLVKAYRSGESLEASSVSALVKATGFERYTMPPRPVNATPGGSGGLDVVPN
jgi:hypothetical protein